MPQIISKTEEALAAYLLAGQTLCPTVLAGESTGDKVVQQLIECYCPQGDEEPAFSGNFWVETQIMVKTAFGGPGDGSDAKPGHDALAEAVFNLMVASNLPALLSTAGTDFTCMGVETWRPESKANEDVWETTLRGRLYCAGVDL